MLDGDDGADILYGRKGRDSLSEGTGADDLYGDRGRDDLTGGDDADKLIGGRGSDTLQGGAGNDHLWGGTYSGDFGEDVFVMHSGMDSDYVHDFNTADDVLDLSDMGLTWSDVSAALNDLGWATQVNLGHFGGAWSDQIFLIGVTATDLSAANFDLGLMA